ncbi:MAG: pyridoxamine 5'-phosphate oxidase family protein [Myxococcota bacterium]
MPSKVVESAAELRSILGEPSVRAANKDRQALHAMDRRWLAQASFCLVATADATGRCAVSPKGDPAGFVHVLDDTHLALPERPGNKRADGFHHVLENPHVGLLFVIPGRSDTLRIHGKARVVREADYFDALVVNGHRPRLALEVEIETLFYHCAKAFLRSRLWDHGAWTPEAMPSRAEIVKAIEAPETSLEDLEAHYGPSYAKGLYGEG